MIRSRLLQVLQDYFDDQNNVLTVVSPSLPFVEDIEIRVKVTITMRSVINGQSDYEIEMRLFESNDLEQFKSKIADYSNTPVVRPLSQLIDSLEHIHYDWHIHWSSSLRTWCNAVQFIQLGILPMVDLSWNNQAMTISPQLLPGPGCTVPELLLTFKNRNCYIGSFHVCEHSLRLVIDQVQSGGLSSDMKPIIIDLDCEQSSFKELLELKSQEDDDIVDEIMRYLTAFDDAKATKFNNDPDLFRKWINQTATGDNDWKDYYVDTC